MRRVVAAILLGACLAASGCGQGGAEESGEAAVGVGEVRAGSVAALAQCRDWIEGTEEQRLATIEDIHAQLNQAGSSGPTPDLPEEEAYDLFERACANDFAYGFRLYKLYARGAAFGSFDEQSPE